MTLWVDHLLDEVKSGFKSLLPFNKQEYLFIHTVREEGGIRPELITSDVDLASKINSHPALLWVAKKLKK